MGKGHSKNYDVNVVSGTNGDITGIKYTEVSLRSKFFILILKSRAK